MYRRRCTAKVYISGPMTGYKELNRPAFDKMAIILNNQGYTVVNPSSVCVDGWEWKDYMHHDLRMLRSCDAIVFLDGWEHSKGACIERRYAKRLGISFINA